MSWQHPRRGVQPLHEAPDERPASNWVNPQPPRTIPTQMPDRYEHPQTLIYGPRGEPLIQRVPRHFGFRPPEDRP